MSVWQDLLAEQNRNTGSGLLLPPGEAFDKTSDARKPWEPPAGMRSPGGAADSPRGSTMELTGLTAAMLRNSVMDLTGLSTATSDSMQDDADEGVRAQGDNAFGAPPIFCFHKAAHPWHAAQNCRAGTSRTIVMVNG